MAIRDVFKFTWKTFLPSGWLYGEYEQLKNQNSTIVSILKRLFTKNTPERAESFEAAIARLGLSEEDVKRIGSTYRLYAIFFFIIGISLFAYAFYLLFSHVSVTGFLLALATTGLCLAQAFRFDFWSYQMRVRKLGVSFDEWMRSILGDKGTST